MKTNVKKWLLSLAIVTISAVSFGQAQNLKVYNNTSEPLYVQAWAVDDCNGQEQVTVTYYIISGGVANIPVIYNTGTYPNAEWLVVRASENSFPTYGYWTGENTNLICTSFTNYPFFVGSGASGSTIITGINWSSSFIATIN